MKIFIKSLEPDIAYQLMSRLDPTKDSIILNQKYHYHDDQIELKEMANRLGILVEILSNPLEQYDMMVE